jgi:hypothetical protein
MSRAPPRDQHRREYCIQNDRQHLHDHGRLHYSGAAQRGTHGNHRKLQRQTRKEPPQIVDARADRGGICPQSVHVRRRDEIADDERQDPARGGQREALIEHPRRIRLILASHRMRDERNRAHADDLRQRKNDEHDVAGGADSGNRRIAQPRDEIQIDQEIKRLKQHSRRNGQRHLQDVLTDGVRRKILHGTALITYRAGSLDGPLTSRPLTRGPAHFRARS